MSSKILLFKLLFFVFDKFVELLLNNVFLNNEDPLYSIFFVNIIYFNVLLK